jgi:hypothetical protein
MPGPQEVWGGRHDVVESGVGIGDRREPEEAFHGRLDLHLHRTRARLSQSVQTNEIFHSEGNGNVPGSSKLALLYVICLD